MITDEEILKARGFTRRAFIIGVGKISLFSLLIGRLSYLQLIKSADYQDLAENNYIRSLMILPTRGLIRDRANRLLATNIEHYQLIYSKVSKAKTTEIITKLTDLLEFSDQQRQEITAKINDSTNKIIQLKNQLTWQELVRLEVNSVDLPGVQVIIINSRYYPFSHFCAHLIGYLANNDVIKNQNSSSESKVGKFGLEKGFDKILAGKNGIKQIAVNAHGLAIREIAKEEAVNGQDIKLTLDVKLQEELANILPQNGASGILLDVNNGDILAMHSNPSFNPNEFNQKLSNKYWQSLLSDPNSPLINRAISSTYSPGSIFKLVVALAGLNEGIAPELRFNCNGFIIVGKRKFRCWQKSGHGLINIIQALAQSCNCFFFQLACQIGIDSIINMAHLLGLEAEFNFGLVNQRAGFLPTKKWKLKRFNKDWQTGDTINSSIGQGFVSTTPLHLAIMCARIASGLEITPNINYNADYKINNLAILSKHLQIIRQGMNQVTNSPFGTAYQHRIVNSKLAMAGKSGTVQLISKKQDSDDYSRADTILKHKNHGLFIAYAPVIAPRYACAVVVEHAGSGLMVAPIARSILLSAQNQ